jgi:c-di-GMP-binding flagellar brake protein YcgR
VTQLLGFHDGKSVVVTSAEKSVARVAASLKGKSFKVHIMSQGLIYTFDSQLLKALTEPYIYWHLQYPKIINVSDIRKNTRVELQLPVAIEYQNLKLAGIRDIPNIVLCTDISLEGIGIDAPLILGEIGDEFFVTLRLQIAGVDQVVLISVQLKSSRMSEQGVYTHGFQFDDLEDENKVLIAAYVYKQALATLGYVND